jgi:hypothetical protein
MILSELSIHQSAWRNRLKRGSSNAPSVDLAAIQTTKRAE